MNADITYIYIPVHTIQWIHLLDCYLNKRYQKFHILQNAILTAMNYDRCRALPPAERAQCHLNKALVNVGAMFAQEVEGRVCTQVDVRAAGSSTKMVAEVDQLSALYEEMGVTAEKLIFRLPAVGTHVDRAGSM